MLDPLYSSQVEAVDIGIVGLTDYEKTVYRANKHKLEGDVEKAVQSNPSKRAQGELPLSRVKLLVFREFRPSLTF